MKCHVCGAPAVNDAMVSGGWQPVCGACALSLGRPIRVLAPGRVTVGPSPGENTRREVLEVLRLAVRYLEHPDVQAMPFAAPVQTVVERAREAIRKAEEEGWLG